MSEETKNELLLAHFAVNSELKTISRALTNIIEAQDKLSKILYPKHPEGNGHAIDTSTHD